ncbi:MAG: ABC transporter ATP-binding protein [Solirubrobacteraceae bacterium]
MVGPPASDAAVSVTGVSKQFRIPSEQVHTLKERALHPFRPRQHTVLEALDDISLEIPRGEFFGIVGRNGSGKSTLMKCLAGIYRADAGEIWLRGRLAPFIELGVGFNPELTARDNVQINAIMFGLTPAEARARFDRIIDFAELHDFVDLKLKNYSSGMQVRLAFSVMVHVDADVLLIDEVLAVGDASFQQKCHDVLVEMREAGRTILLVTHDMNAVQRFCHRAVLLEAGHVVAIGGPREIGRQYEEINFRGETTADDPASPHTGDGAAAILDAWFEDRHGGRSAALAHGAPAAGCMLVEFRQETVDPIFGFVVTDGEHEMVFSATSAWRHGATGSFGAGERVEVRASFENVLAPGRYQLSPEVAHDGPGRRLMDHRQDAASAVVTGAREGVGRVDLPNEISIDRIGEPAPTAAERG